MGSLLPLQQLFGGNARLGHGVGVQNFFKGLLIQNALLQDEILHGAAGLNGPFGQVGRRLVADMGAQGRDDAHAVVHHGLAPRGVGRDPHDAVVHQCMYRVGQGLHRLDEMIKDNGLKGVELQLSAFRCHGDGHIVANDIEGHLAHHFGDDRVDLARHDRAARLELGQNDFAKAGTRAGGQETQVIADLRELDGEALAGRREGDIGAAVGRGGDQVIAVDERDARQFSEALDSLGRVFRMAGNRRAEWRWRRGSRP